jgi:hypothetical protein
MLTFLHDVKANAVIGASHNTGVTISGSAEDVGDYVDCAETIGQLFAIILTGSSTGTPDSFDHAAKLVEATASNGTGKQDVDGTETVQLTAVDTVYTVRANNRSLRYAAVSITPVFVGGTSPTLAITSLIVMQKERF